MSQTNLKTHQVILRVLCLFTFIAFTAMTVKAQTTVTGNVTGPEGEPLIGVTILADGTTTGTTTDIDGNYTLKVPEGVTALAFSYTGYKREVVEINGRSSIDLQMDTDVGLLDEVVVIGYGTARKRDLTGSVASIDGSDLNSQPINSLEQGLQGRLAGVQIVSNSSSPGGGISVRIRGNTSILNGSEPLYVIDGFPITGQSQFNTDAGRGFDSSTGSNYTVDQNPLSTLNPADIESIEVLKDASATAIYGVRGANGVVLITTKRGQTGAPKLSYNGYVGSQSAAKTYDVLNAQEFQDYANLAETNAGNPPIYTGAPAVDNDWQDMVLRNATMQNHQLTLSGGTDVIKYLVSTGYFNQQGIIKKSGFERFSTRLNLDVNVNERLKIGNSLTVSRSVNNSAFTEGEARNGVMNAAILLAPSLPIFQPDGTYTTGADLEVPNAGGSENPIALLDETSDKGVNTRILGTVFGEYKLTGNLTARVSLGVDAEKRDRQVFRTSLYNDSGINAANVSNVTRTSLLNENTLNYNRSMGKHSFGALLGYTVQSEQEEFQGIGASNFATDITGPYDLGGGSNTPNVNSAFAEFNIMSFIGRVNYNFDDKYLLTLTGRRDGSSKFAEGNKWAFFPSVAAAWRLSSEPFMAGIAQTFDNIKLRVGWGVAGNQELPPYRSLALLQSANYNFGNGTTVSGFSPLSVPVPDLTWETTRQINAGIDLSSKGGRFNLTVDYYNKQTEDLLVEVILPETSGITQPSVQNLGKMENRGIEVALDAVAITRGDFSWRLGANFSKNVNEVTSLGDEDKVGDLSFIAAQPTFAGSTVRSQVIVGQPIGVFYGWDTEGLIRNEAEAAAEQELRPGIIPGMVRFIDTNGDGFVDEDDRAPLASPFPDFIYGVNSNMTYKNFGLRIFIQGQKGGTVMNSLRRFATPGAGVNGILRERLDFWTPDNPDAFYPAPNSAGDGGGIVVGGSTANAGESDYYLEDASYLRFREITLTYNLPESFLGGKVGGNIYITGQNLFTISDYSGLNPDVNSRSGIRASFGYDFSSYPLAKTILVGINLNL